MAREIVMPQLGIAMESGRVARWLKQSGDLVAAGDVLLEVESDKAVVDVEAVAAGRLHVLAGEAGSDVKVGAVIGYILAPGESVPRGGPAPGLPAQTADATRAAGPGRDVSRVAAPGSGARRLPSSPAARRRAALVGVDWRQAAGTGPGGCIKERDVLRLAQALQAASPDQAAPPALSLPGSASSTPGQLDDLAFRISPLARELADELGIDPAVLAARFPGRRVQREDVLLAAREWLQGKAPPAPQVAPGARRAARRLPMGSVRRLIAGRMSQSSQANAAVTLTTEADATELVRLREALARLASQGAGQPAPGYTVLLAKLAARALQDHPDLNASLVEDGEIVYWAAANIGIAVDTPRGLVVPVLCDVDARPLSRLAAEAEDLLGRARQGKATPEELTGGTFTITNLGVYEIDAFTPIINPPECAILGVGRLRRVPAFDEAGALVPRTHLYLSLTFDHRLVDGAPAARFLQQVKRFVEEPYLWLAE